MSTLSTANIESKAANTPPVIKDLNGTECGQFCRAWVNFNGVGTVAIRASFNVSSITDNGTGDYTVNFTTAMADSNYAAVLSANLSGTNDGLGRIGEGFFSTSTYVSSSCRVKCLWQGDGTTTEDKQIINVAVFGG